MAVISALPAVPAHKSATPVGETDVPAGRPAVIRVLPLCVVVVAAAACATAYANWGLQVHRALHTAAFDLGFFDQIIWNTAHGRPFDTTYVPYSFFGQHWEPLLLLFVPPYRLGAGPEFLIVTQAVGACAAAVPLFLAGRRLVGAEPALALALAYLVSPTLQRGLDFGFHPDLFEPLFAFTALAALLAGRRRLALVPLVLLLVAKEDAFLLAALLGWICVLRGERRFGLTIVAVSCVWGVAVIGVAMPLLRHGLPSDLVERYGYLGASPTGIVAGASLHPDRVLAQLATARIIGAMLLLLVTTGFLPLLAPNVLVGTVPVALVGLLSLHPQQASLDLQYGAPVLAACFIAALFGLQNLRSAIRRRQYAAKDPRLVRVSTLPCSRLVAAVALLALAGALAGAVLRGPYPGEGRYAAWRFHDYGEAASLRRVAARIPAGASVSAQTGLATQLSQRQQIWEFPLLESAEYVVLERGGIVSGASLGRYAATVSALPALGYTEVADDGRISLYQREGAGAR